VARTRRAAIFAWADTENATKRDARPRRRIADSKSTSGVSQTPDLTERRRVGAPRAPIQRPVAEAVTVVSAPPTTRDRTSTPTGQRPGTELARGAADQRPQIAGTSLPPPWSILQPATAQGPWDSSFWANLLRSKSTPPFRKSPNPSSSKVSTPGADDDVTVGATARSKTFPWDFFGLMHFAIHTAAVSSS